jgi:hypothetical protein
MHKINRLGFVVCGWDSCSSGKGSCEHGNEHAVSIETGNFLTSLESIYWPVRKDSVSPI